MAIYNREYCEDYFRKIRQLDDVSFVGMWAHMADLVHRVPAVAVDAWLIEWANMAPWNRQQVLFLMTPEIDRIARERAMAAAKKARVEDPL